MNDVLVLCYHGVSRRWHSGMAVTPDALESQVVSLLDRGYRGVTFHDAVANPPSGRVLAVTFDDAYRSVHQLARPVLEQLHVPATVFAPTALMGGGLPMSWSGIDSWTAGPFAPELIPMDWDELGELHGLGWEVGSHTRTHPRLPELDAASLKEELDDSRAECERRIGAQCRSIAYPFGDYDQRVVEATRSAGYSAAGALAGRVRNAGPLEWPRVGIYRSDDTARFRAKVSPATRRVRASRLWRARVTMRRRR